MGYVYASTSNPLGRRPWQSRLTPGLGSYFPNFAAGGNPKIWRIADLASPNAPCPDLYTAPELSGLGFIAAGGPGVRYRTPYTGPGGSAQSPSTRLVPSQSGTVIANNPVPVVVESGGTASGSVSSGATTMPVGGGWQSWLARRRAMWAANQASAQSSGGVSAGAAGGTAAVAAAGTSSGSPPVGISSVTQNANGLYVYTLTNGQQILVGLSATGSPVYMDTSGNAVGVTTNASGQAVYTFSSGASVTLSSVLAAPPTVSSAAALATTGVAATSWFSEDSLGLGYTNAAYLAVAAGLYFVFKKK